MVNVECEVDSRQGCCKIGQHAGHSYHKSLPWDFIKGEGFFDCFLKFTVKLVFTITTIRGHTISALTPANISSSFSGSSVAFS